jgi:hypothetical protein
LVLFSLLAFAEEEKERRIKHQGYEAIVGIETIFLVILWPCRVIRITVLLPDPRSIVVRLTGMMLIDTSPLGFGKVMGIILISPASAGSEVGVGRKPGENGPAPGALGTREVLVSTVATASEEDVCIGTGTLGGGESGYAGNVVVEATDDGDAVTSLVRRDDGGGRMMLPWRTVGVDIVTVVRSVSTMRMVVMSAECVVRIGVTNASVPDGVKVPRMEDTMDAKDGKIEGDS